MVVVVLSACSGPGKTFQAREIPEPEWLRTRYERLCVSRDQNSPQVAGLAEGNAPRVATSGDVACFVTSDTSGGGAIVDFSGDGLPDIIWTSSVLGGPTVFLRNDGGFRFTDVSDKVAPGVDLTYTNGVAVGDVDRDGTPDIFFMAFGRREPVLLMANGDGTFRDATEESRIPESFNVSLNGTGAVFGDYDGDGWLDLHTTEARLVELDDRKTPGGARLFRNLGGEGKPGVFEDVTESAGVRMRQANGAMLAFLSAFHDYDGDGKLDLHVVSDFNTSRIFLNNGDGTFRDGFEELPITDDESGMGLAIGDVTGDGTADIFVVAASQLPPPAGDLRSCTEVDPARSFGRDGSTGNGLFAGGKNGFTEVTDDYGVRHGGWGWGAILLDYDLDSRLDILQVASHNVGISIVKSYCTYPDSDQSVVRLWRNTGGSTEETSAESGLVVTGRLKSPLAADLDGDGDEDFIILRSGDKPLLFENRSPRRDHIVLSFAGGELPQNAKIVVKFDQGPDVVRYAMLQNGLYAARYADEIIGFEGRGTPVSVTVEYRSGKTFVVDEIVSGQKVVLP